MKNKKMIALSIFVIGINFIEIKNYLNTNFYSNIKDRSVITKVMSYNVLGSNTNYESLIELVNKEQPDILVLQEVNEIWDENLIKLYSQYKNIHKKIKSDNFGIVFLTNYDVLSSEGVYYDPNKRLPSISIKLLINDKEYNIIGTHPVPAVSNRSFKSRNTSLMNMVSNDFNKTKSIIIGDLNTSMWSNIYKDFTFIGNLKNTREGFGINNSWSTNLHMFLFQVPIDHILVTKDISVHSFNVLKDIGSDHYPIISELVLQ